MAAPKFDIEAHSDTATLYLRLPLTIDDMDDLRISCSLLPLQVRNLRVDAQAIDRADTLTLDVVSEIVRYWRRSRGGRIALHASERLMTADSRDGSGILSPEVPPRPDDAAIFGTYL